MKIWIEVVVILFLIQSFLNNETTYKREWKVKIRWSIKLLSIWPTLFRVVCKIDWIWNIIRALGSTTCKTINYTSFVVNVHDDTGNVVLSTGNLEMDAVAGMSHEGICSVAKCIDGHFRDLLRKISPLFYMTGIILLAFYIFYSQSNSLHRNTKNKKLKWHSKF